MTGQEHSRGGRREGRSLLRQSRYISTAAMQEVVELGHPELDVDHLLIALLVTGGPSASCLVRAGVDLPSLRGAVRRMQEGDATALGVHVRTPPARSAALADRSTNGVPWGSRAMAVMRSAPHDEDDRALLRALLDDEGRRVARVLTEAGVDVEDLRARLSGTTTVAPPDLPAGVADALAALGPARRRTAASVTQEVPVDADAVWALVGDVRHRAGWDPAVTSVGDDADGVLRLVYGQGRRTRSVRVLTERTGPRSVMWRELWDDDEHVSAVLHLFVVPAGAGSRLRIDSSTVLRARRHRALRPLARRVAASRVRWLGHSIARVAAGGEAR